jgi:hypothetical protein
LTRNNRSLAQVVLGLAQWGLKARRRRKRRKRRRRR